MDGPRPRLPERSGVIHADGVRIKVEIIERDGVHEIEVIGNRLGMRSLAAICEGLAELSDEDLLTPANHYHIDPFLMANEVEPGSANLTIYCHENDHKYWNQPATDSN
jgi:hypothetical protein